MSDLVQKLGVDTGKIEEIASNPAELKKLLPLILELKTDNFGAALAMLGGGLFIAYMGIRLFKPFLAISGIFIGGITFYFGYQKLLVFNFLPTWTHLPWIVFCLGGIIGSVLFIKAWNLGTYALSAYGGVMLSILVKGMISGFEFSKYLDKTVLMFIFGALGLVFAKFIRDTAIICASALSGAFLIFLGIDNLKPVGFRSFMNEAIIGIADTSKSADFSKTIQDNFNKAFETEIKYCLIGIVVVTITGIYTQFQNKPRSKLEDD